MGAPVGTSVDDIRTLPSEHKDLVQTVDFNRFGERMVTGSSDHRIRVWDCKDDGWRLVDTFRGHDAEVIDVKWNGPFMGQNFSSIGEDGKFKVWEEDVAESPNSGRRFKCISSLTSSSRVPYASLAFKNAGQFDTWVALITRDGVLSIYEPTEPESLANWQPLAQFDTIRPRPPRGEETSFKVRFHQEPLPCYTAIAAGLDRKSLAIVVAAMDTVKIYRTNRDKQFYQAAELTGHRGLVRDVAWADGSVRGYDLIATASRDMIRIFEVSTPQPSGGLKLALSDVPESPRPEAMSSNQGRGARNAPSGIGAVGDTDSDPSQVKHVVKQSAAFAAQHGAVWKVEFGLMGEEIVTAGDDGKVRSWRQAANTGQWIEFAELS